MIILLIIMSMAVITDIRSYKIPNKYILTGFISGMGIRYFQEGFQGLFTALFFMVIIFIFLFPFFLMHGIGAGDIKLFCMMTAYLNKNIILECFLLTFTIASVMSIVKMLWQGTLLLKIKKILYYLEAVALTQSYREYEDKEYMKDKKNSIRMSLPAIISVMFIMVKNEIGVFL